MRRNRLRLAFMVLILWSAPVSAATISSGSVELLNEGVSQGAITKLDAVGAGVDATRSGTTGTLTILGLSAPATLYVCADTGATCNTSTANAGISATATLPCLQDALDKLPGLTKTDVTIFVASNTSAYNCTVNTGINGLVANFHVREFVAGGKHLTIKGIYNSASHSFTSVPIDTGTSSGSNTNDFPVTAAGAVGSTAFNDTSKAWGVNAYLTFYLHLTGGTGYSSTADENNWYTIYSNTATQLLITGNWRVATPDGTTTYEIFNPNQSPTFTATGVNVSAMITSSENVVIQAIRLSTPALSPSHSIWAWRSRYEFFQGDLGANSHHSNSVYAIYKASRSITANFTAKVADAGPIAYVVYDGVDMRNWQYSAVNAIQMATIWVIGSYANSGVAGAANQGAFMAVQRGRLQVTRSRAQGPSGGFAILGTAASVDLLDKPHAICSSNAGGNYGVYATIGSDLTSQAVGRVEGCNIGVVLGTESVWYAPTALTYSGNTTNEVINASATKTTTLY